MILSVPQHRPAAYRAGQGGDVLREDETLVVERGVSVEHRRAAAVENGVFVTEPSATIAAAIISYFLRFLSL